MPDREDWKGQQRKRHIQHTLQKKNFKKKIEISQDIIVVLLEPATTTKNTKQFVDHPRADISYMIYSQERNQIQFN